MTQPALPACQPDIVWLPTRTRRQYYDCPHIMTAYDCTSGLLAYSTRIWHEVLERTSSILTRMARHNWNILSCTNKLYLSPSISFISSLAIKKVPLQCKKGGGTQRGSGQRRKSQIKAISQLKSPCLKLLSKIHTSNIHYMCICTVVQHHLSPSRVSWMSCYLCSEVRDGK